MSTPAGENGQKPESVWARTETKYAFACLVAALLLANLVLLGYGWLGQPQPSGTRELPGGHKTVQLVSEVFPAPGQNAGSRALPGSSGAAGCLGLGPFPDLAAGSRMQQRLADLGLAAELLTVDEDTGGKDYRVLLPPADSSSAAFRTLRELKAQKIDSFVIREGPYALGISLGVFSTLGAAKRMQEQIIRQNYPAELAPIPRLQRRYWAVLADGSKARMARQAAASAGVSLKESMSCQKK